MTTIKKDNHENDTEPAQASHCESCSVSDNSSSEKQTKIVKLTRVLTGVSGAFLAFGFVLSFVLQIDTWGTVAYLVSILAGGVFVVWSAVKGIVKQRFLNISFLVAIASMGAIYIGQYGEAAAVVFLFSLAEFFESYGIERSRRAVAALIKRSPKIARLLDGSEVPVEEITIGTIVVIRPGEQVPLDGTVSKGRSTIDESAITGESSPLDKVEEDFVYAGTMNIQGYLEVRVEKESKDSTFSQIITMIKKAQASRAPTQAFIDMFAKFYTPAVVVASLLMVVIPVVFFGQAFDVWLYRALILLVVACPCALVIATPVAVASAIGGASRHGILIKGGKYLEKLSKIKMVAMDKTRTLTYGEHTVTDVLVFGTHSKEEVLADAAGIETFSSHPLASAILEYAKKEGIDIHEMESYKDVAGKGGSAHCIVCDAHHYIGNTKLMKENNIDDKKFRNDVERLEREGKTVVLVADESEMIGLIAITDKVRDEANVAVADLKKMGVSSSILTGDNQYSALYVAKLVGITDVFASLLPEEKVEHVIKLKNQYGATAMVGDGVNDAPSLVTSDVGFSMGAGGTDVAIESSDVTFLSGDLRAIAKSIRLGKRAMKIIHVNIALALGIKVVFLILAAFGMTSLVFAIAADSGMAVIVILNSLRLFSVR